MVKSEQVSWGFRDRMFGGMSLGFDHSQNFIHCSPMLMNLHVHHCACLPAASLSCALLAPFNLARRAWPACTLYGTLGVLLSFLCWLLPEA